MICVFYQTKIILFVGSIKNSNTNFNEKKLILYDLDKQIKIDSQSFDSEILNIKVLNKIIFVTTKNKLTIFDIVTSEDDTKLMKFVDSIKFDNEFKGLFDIEFSNYENNRNIIAVEKSSKSIELYMLFHNSPPTLHQINLIEHAYKSLQKIIMTNKYLFVVEELGVYSKCYSLLNVEKFFLICEL